MILAGSGFPHVANPPNTLAKALAWVGGEVRGEVSQDLIVLLLRYFGTLGDG